MPDLEKMTLSDLKILAKENNIKNISKLKKEDLIGILQQISHHHEILRYLLSYHLYLTKGYEEVETISGQSGLCTRSGRNHHGGCAYPENGRRV